MKKICIIILVCSAFIVHAQKFEGLALTPPMGWNSWNTFKTDINEKMVKEMADDMVSSGMRDAGYIYLVLDDGWMAPQRDSAGNLLADPVKFPNGMKAVADYVHSKGLKFGLYNCAGTKTCAGYPGTHGYEFQDAKFYAGLGVDFLKYDWCYTEGINPREAYTTMSRALREAGRPIVFSLCEWGESQPWEWAAPVGHLWRTAGDIYHCFNCVFDHGTWVSLGIMQIVDKRKNIRQYAGPGHWNDPDMMEVGNGMTVREDRSHFTLWAMQAAPLIAGNDIRKMSKKTRSILTNKELIGINQDSLGIQGFRYQTMDSVDVWLKPLKGNDWAVAFVNTSANARKIKYAWKQLKVFDSVSHREINTGVNVYKLRNLWSKKLSGDTREPLKSKIKSHDVLVFKLSLE